jgi:hypothetical protein
VVAPKGVFTPFIADGSSPPVHFSSLLAKAQNAPETYHAKAQLSFGGGRIDVP